jgi:hypothetical protein
MSGKDGPAHTEGGQAHKTHNKAHSGRKADRKSEKVRISTHASPALQTSSCVCACACACVRDRARFLPIDMYSHSTARTLTLVCAVDTCTSIHRWHSTTCTKGPPHHTRTHRHSLPLTATHYPYRHRRCDCDHRSPMFARSPHTNKDGKGKHELGFNPKAFSVQRPQKIRKRFQHKQVRAHCVIHSLS